MEQKAILGVFFVIFITSILFIPQGSDRWQGLLFIGIIFGALWFFKK
jgi:hypothetical protein